MENLEKSNYELVKEVVRMCDEKRIENEFLEEFKVGENVSKERFISFFERFFDGYGDEYEYNELNWEWVESGGDYSIFNGK